MTSDLLPWPDDEKFDRIRLFKDQIEYLIPDPLERRWFVQWMAYNVQFPEKRCQVTPLHVSPLHGTGRGWLAKVMMALLGDWNCATAEMSDLSKEKNQFNGQFLDKKILCVIHEVRQYGDRFSIDSNLRSLLTDSHLEVNTKHGARGTQQVYVNFLMFTNHTDAMILSNDDRRINVLTGPDHLRDNEWFKHIYEWLDADVDEYGEHRRGGHVTTLFKWLRDDVSLDDFNSQRSFHTLGRSVMIAAAKSDTEHWVDTLLEATEFNVMAMDDIKDEIRLLAGVSEFNDSLGLNDKHLAHILRDKRCYRADRMRIDNQRYRLWVFKNGVNMDEDQIKVEYQRYKDSKNCSKCDMGGDPFSI